MGICESKGKEQTTAVAPNTVTQPINTAANATQNQGGVLGNLFGSNNNQQQTQQQNTGVIETIKNAVSGSNQTNQQQSGGVVETIKNAIGGSNQNTTTNANPSKMDTVKKVVQFGVENKEALGKLLS